MARYHEVCGTRLEGRRFRLRVHIRDGYAGVLVEMCGLRGERYGRVDADDARASERERSRDGSGARAEVDRARSAYLDAEGSQLVPQSFREAARYVA